MDTFPEELIDHICSFADMGVLCSLSRVSRQFRRIAEPHLYRTICAIFDGPFDPGYSKTDVLISTLKRRPHLRPYVKVLNAECSTEYRSSIPNQYHSLLSFRAKCDQDVHDIITLAPMMETIDMYDFVAEESLGQSWLEILPALHQHTYLKRFDIDLGSSVLTDLHHLFALPNIEIMDLRRGETNYDDEKALRHWENMKSNLRQLSIVDLRTHDQVSDVADDVKLIARSCPKLHSLESFGVVYTYGSNYFRALIRAFTIPAIKNQLSYVEMWDLRVTPRPNHICSQEYPLTDAFRETSIMGMHLQLSILDDKLDDSASFKCWPGRNLPRTLETLKLDFLHPTIPFTDPRSCTRAVNGLRYFCNSNFRSALPKLRELTLTYVPGQAWHEEDWMVPVRAKLKEKGVEFEIEEFEFYY